MQNSSIEVYKEQSLDEIFEIGLWKIRNDIERTRQSSAPLKGNAYFGVILDKPPTSESAYRFVTKIVFNTNEIVSHKFICEFDNHRLKKKLRFPLLKSSTKVFYLCTNEEPELSKLRIKGADNGALEFSTNPSNPEILLFKKNENILGRTWLNESGRRRLENEGEFLRLLGLSSLVQKDSRERYVIARRFILYPYGKSKSLLDGLSNYKLGKMISSEGHVSSLSCGEFIRIKDSSFYKDIAYRIRQKRNNEAKKDQEKIRRQIFFSLMQTIDQDRFVCSGQLLWNKEVINLNFYFEVLFFISFNNEGLNFAQFEKIVFNFFRNTKIANFLEGYNFDFELYFKLFLLNKMSLKLSPTALSWDNDECIFWKDCVDELRRNGKLKNVDDDIDRDLGKCFSNLDVRRILFLENANSCTHKKAAAIHLILRQFSEIKKVEDQLNEIKTVVFWKKRRIRFGYQYDLYAITGDIISIKIQKFIAVRGLVLLRNRDLFRLSTSNLGSFKILGREEERLLKFVYKSMNDELHKSMYQFPLTPHMQEMIKRLWNLDMDNNPEIKKCLGDSICRMVIQSNHFVYISGLSIIRESARAARSKFRLVPGKKITLTEIPLQFHEDVIFMFQKSQRLNGLKEIKIVNQNKAIKDVGSSKLKNYLAQLFNTSRFELTLVFSRLMGRDVWVIAPKKHKSTSSAYNEKKDDQYNSYHKVAIKSRLNGVKNDLSKKRSRAKTIKNASSFDTYFQNRLHL